MRGHVDLHEYIKKYIKFCLGKREYDYFPETNNFIIWGTISRFVIYGVAVFNMVTNHKLFITTAIYLFFTSLWLLFLNLYNFFNNLMREKIDEYKDEIIAEYELKKQLLRETNEEDNQ
jgi:hypothetical protein